MTNWQATPIRISSRDRAFYWRRIASRKGRQKSSAFGLTPAQRFQPWSIVPSGMGSSFKTLNQKMGSTVYYLGRLRESRNCIHIAIQGYDTVHPIQIAESYFQVGQLNESTSAGRFVTILDTFVGPDGASNHRVIPG